LNGAFAGKPKNEDAVRSIIEEVGDGVPVQLAAVSAIWKPSSVISISA